jgi:trk system potassium uptake protein TrkA
VYSIGDAEGEVIEAQVMSTSTISGQYIRDIEFPEGVLVGAVRKGTKILKPSGSLRIEEGDHVVLFALAADVAEVERLLQVTVDFF